MEQFGKKLRGYNPAEVTKFVDNVIIEVSNLNNEIAKRDERIASLEDELVRYQSIENTLNKALIAAQNTADQIKSLARQEAELIVEESRKSSSRIINESLMKAEKLDYESTLVKKNIILFKNRLRSIVEGQLEMIDDIDRIDL